MNIWLILQLASAFNIAAANFIREYIGFRIDIILNRKNRSEKS